MQDLENVLDKLGLHRFVCITVHPKGRGCVYLQQPGLALLVHEDVKPKKFKATVVILNGVSELSHCEQHDLLYSVPEGVIVYSFGGKVVSQLLECPFSPSSDYPLGCIVIRSIFVNTCVGQMSKFVIKTLHVVLISSKPNQAFLVDVDL